MRSIRRLAFGGAVGVLAVLAASCGAGETPPVGQAGTPAPRSAGDALGTIAFVDDDGCITRVAAATGQATGTPFCAESRAGITSVSWLDAGSAAFATAEARALGWRKVTFATGDVETMLVAEAPRVFIIPPQFYSPRGEQLEVDDTGVVYRAAETGGVRIFPPAGQDADPSTRLVTWSPDGDWVLLSTSTDKELWMVGRDGASPRRIAASSKGVASWFMPAVGATPHADLTCSVITAGSFSCAAALRSPEPGATLDPLESEGMLDLTWSTCPGATGYQLVVATREGTVLVDRISVGTYFHEELAAVGVTGATDLVWKVRALIGPRQAPWSEERPLRVAAVSQAAAP